MNVNDKLLNGAGLAEVWSIIDGKFGAGSKHWWKRRSNGEGWLPTVLYNQTEMVGRADIPNTTVYWSDSYSVNEEGLFVLNNYQTFISNYATSPDPFIGKYFSLSSHRRLSSIYYAPDTATTVNAYAEGINYTQIRGIIKYSEPVRSTIVGEWEFLSADSIDAYPLSGIVDGMEYVYLGVPLDNARTPVKIQTGSFIGTGGNGEKNARQLTFDFVPFMVLIFNPSVSNPISEAVIHYPIGLKQGYSGSGFFYRGSTSSHYYAKMNGNVLSFYAYGSSFDLSAMCNSSGTEYKWYAIGSLEEG